MAFLEHSNGVRYPDDLFSTPHWYALRTRSRAEKRSDRLLHAAGVESYAAVASVERAWSDRRRRVGLPLFPGYIFARFALSDIAAALSVPGIVGVIRNQGIPVPLREAEMGAVRRLAEGVSLSGVLPSEADYLTTGDLVVVTSGPFEGMEGVLVEARGRAHVSVRIAAIRQARSVELERSVLRSRRGGA